MGQKPDKFHRYSKICIRCCKVYKVIPWQSVGWVVLDICFRKWKKDVLDRNWELNGGVWRERNKLFINGMIKVGK